MTQNLVVGHEVMPADVQDTSLASYMEGIQSSICTTINITLDLIEQKIGTTHWLLLSLAMFTPILVFLHHYFQVTIPCKTDRQTGNTRNAAN